MNFSDYVVVIPSIRNINLEYINSIPLEVAILVVDDSDGSIQPNRENMKVFYYKDQKRIMGENYDLIPHKTAACRNFAFYYVWKETDYRYIITIDDDCNLPGSFIEDYEVLGQTLQMGTLICEGWFNTIDILNLNERLFARGYPYWERYDKEINCCQTEGRLVCLMGMWEQYLDTDGLDKFLFEKYQKTYSNVKINSNIYRIGVPESPTKFPFCAMNFGFVREALPIMYQMPMSDMITTNYPIWRFDDIWAGYVIESMIHKNGDAIAIGKPIVVHQKEGNLIREVRGEHYGHLMSPYFYEIIDLAIETIKPGNYAEMYVELFDSIVVNFEKIRKRDKIPTLYCNYFQETFNKLLRWGKLFL